MKKIIVLILIVSTAIGQKLSAQVFDLSYSQLSRTEQVFNVNNPGWLRHKFDIYLTKGNYITLMLSDKMQFEKLLNLDSLLRNVFEKIQFIKDSSQNELTNKKIDFAISKDGMLKMRFQEFKPRGNSYGFKDKELVALKIEQDTINITGYYRNDTASRVARRGIYFVMPYRIIIHLNNISDLGEYLDGRINKAMLQLKSDWDNYKGWSPKKNWNSKLTASYFTFGSDQNVKIHSQAIGQGKLNAAPFVQISAQNIRNLFGSSAGVGIDFYKFDNNYREKHLQLFWEPYFFFEKNSASKTVLMRNDFVTLQYRDIREVKPYRERQTIKYYQQFILSFLLHKDGDYFEKNTFRIGFPGFQHRNVSLVPEFIFHDFFKQFFPGLKLSLYFE